MGYDYKEKELKLFWFWINERHMIYVKRKAGKKWPWTSNKILQDYKFTNAFRQLDRVTEAWTDRWCRLLHMGKNMKDGDILFHLCMFRFFNWPETYDALYFNLKPRWDLYKAIALLRERKEVDHEQIFTGAYIITSGGRKDPKHEVICEALDDLYKVRHKMARRIVRGRSMEKATEILQEINTVGPFIAYEIVCDLRHTRILAHARDINSWANAGPGAKRGIHRLLTGDKEWNKNYKWPKSFKLKGGSKPDYNLVMRDLLNISKAHLGQHVKDCQWPFEMREIEHSLCEFDKMRRVMKGEGKPRSIYRPKLQEDMFEQKEAPWV